MIVHTIDIRESGPDGLVVEITVHRRHSRRLSESAYLCVGHSEAHREGVALRLRVESNR